MKRRLSLWCGLGLFLAAGMVLAVPASRYPVLGYLGIESLHNGRPIAFWIAALKDNDASERRRAALMLGDACDCTDRPEDDICRQVIASLIDTLGDPDGFVRKCAATSFLMYPREMPVPRDSSSIGRMTEALRDDQVAVRKAAVRALWQAGPAAKEAEGVARLTVALRDKDDFVRAYATRALAHIGPDAKAAVPALIQCRRTDEERYVRKLAGKALGLIGPNAVGPLLPEAVQALLPGLKDANDEMREYTARALGQLGARDAIPALQSIATDRDEDVRAAVAEALKKLGAANTKKSP